MEWYEKLRGGQHLPQHYKDFLDALGYDGEEVLIEYLKYYHSHEIYNKIFTIGEACNLVWRDFE